MHVATVNFSFTPAFQRLALPFEKIVCSSFFLFSIGKLFDLKRDLLARGSLDTHDHMLVSGPLPAFLLLSVVASLQWPLLMLIVSHFLHWPQLVWLPCIPHKNSILCRLVKLLVFSSCCPGLFF